MDRNKVKPEVKDFPGPEARKVISRYDEVAAKSTRKYGFVWDFTEDAIGPFCKDIDGNILLDFAGHGGAAPLGYNNKKIKQKLDNFDIPEPSKMYGQCFYTESDRVPSPIDLMEKITSMSDNMDMVFLSNSGAEAVENGIKICYDYTSGDYGITFQNAFHGRTLGALSLNRSKGKHRSKFPSIQKIEDVPYCQKRNCNPKTCNCGFFNSDGSLLRDKLTTSVNPEEVAYIMIEPIQGEGGLNEPSSEFMSEIRQIKNEYNIPLISDEVQAGMGRTGKLWAIENYDIEPDVISSAKGLRVGATISRSEIFPDQKARISSTWGAGDIISSIAGYTTLEVMEEHDLLDNSKEKGKEIKKELKNVSKIKDVRGKGLMIGIEFENKKIKDDFTNKCLDNGLLTLGCGKKTVRLLPPLDITDREKQIGLEIIKKSCQDI
jgi:4-aminobutyrate aminotransferase